MLIEYYGHACFALTSGDTRVVIDPYAPQVGYKLANRGATITLVSHDHFDHNHVESIVGRTSIIRGAAPRQEAGVKIRGVLADHDDCGGSKRGKVTLFCLEMEGLKLVHLSDLGHLLDAEQVEEVGKVDVLFIPCGGCSTLDAQEAAAVVKALKPAVAIPMHYRTPFLNRAIFPDLEGVEPFCQLTRAERGSATLTLTAANLPADSATRVIAMTHLF